MHSNSLLSVVALAARRSNGSVSGSLAALLESRTRQDFRQEDRRSRAQSYGSGSVARLITTVATPNKLPYRSSNFYCPPSSVSIQKRTIFIQTATTPNPESLKFIPNGRLVLGHLGEGSAEDESEGTSDGAGESTLNGVHITRKDQALISRSPLANMLFSLDQGIKSVYLGNDFVTVTKYAEAHWQHLQTPIFAAIMDFYGSGQPALREQPEITDTTIFDDDDEVVAMIKELLETRIRPAVQEDGGDIKYVGFEEDTGIVTVQLAGSCVGCPSSSVTLKNGVENMLMHYIPEVTNVVSLEEEPDEYEGGTADVNVEQTSGAGEDKKKMKSYRDKLAAAGIPFSD
mmetsp:Transcript_32822/g.78409  ORF Transcript_32822/g.78409 Transcript_32822/m.78409 type:complete len:344 (-) Transcript_32822:117-1148(-)